MSLELSGGKVKVNFDLGSGVGSAVSANRHNDGRWKSLTMSRNKKQGTHNNNSLHQQNIALNSATLQLTRLDNSVNEIERIQISGIVSLSACSLVIYVSLTVSKATVTVVDIDNGAEEKIVTTSQGSATGLNLKENQKIYFGGLPTIGNYRYTHSCNTFMCTFRHSHILYMYCKEDHNM